MRCTETRVFNPLSTLTLAKDRYNNEPVFWEDLDGEEFARVTIMTKLDLWNVKWKYSRGNTVAVLEEIGVYGYYYLGIRTEGDVLLDTVLIYMPFAIFVVEFYGFVNEWRRYLLPCLGFGAFNNGGEAKWVLLFRNTGSH